MDTADRHRRRQLIDRRRGVSVSFVHREPVYERIDRGQALPQVQIATGDQTLPVRGDESAVQVLHPAQPTYDLVRRADRRS
jgi:hypothetical protein